MAIQYYNIQKTGEKYAQDKATGKTEKVSVIPAGGATITWTASGLPHGLNIPTPTPTPAPNGKGSNVNNAEIAERERLAGIEKERLGRVTSFTSDANKLLSSGASNFNISKFSSGLANDISADVFKNVPGLSDARNVNVTPTSNPSIIDFLDSVGEASDFNSRSKLARDTGISNYTGTAEQNTRLLGLLRQQSGGGTSGSTATKEAGTQGGVKTPQDEIANYNSLANSDQDTDLSVISETVGGAVDISDSAKIVKALVTSFDQKAKEETSSIAEQFATKRGELGVGELETKLADVDQKIARLDADFSSTLEDEDNRRVSVLQINKRQSDIETRYNRAKRDLQVERNGVVNELNQKYGVLDTMVKIAGMDIDNAQQEWQSQFTNAINLTNLITGIDDRAKSAEEKKTDNARANLQIMYNTIQSGGVSYDKLDAGTKLDIKNMEIQAGFPSGFTKFLSETIDDPVVSFLSPFTDDQGNRIQPVGTKNANGSFTIKNVKLGTAEVQGKDKPISQSKLNELGVAGVPEVVAIDIQNSFNAGTDEAIIKAHLEKELGKERGIQYFDAFKSVMSGSANVVIPN